MCPVKAPTRPSAKFDLVCHMNVCFSCHAFTLPWEAQASHARQLIAAHAPCFQNNVKITGTCPSPLAQAWPGACSVLRRSYECKMGHIPDRRNLPCEAKKAVQPSQTSFPLFTPSFLLCWAWKQSEIMNQTCPSLLATKQCALKSKCWGLLLWAEISIYQGGKSQAWFVPGLSACSRTHILCIVDPWGFSWNCLLRRKWLTVFRNPIVK